VKDGRAMSNRQVKLRGMPIHHVVSLIPEDRLEVLLHVKPRPALKRTRAFEPA
jgi:hypothetical protein